MQLKVYLHESWISVLRGRTTQLESIQILVVQYRMTEFHIVCKQA
jgi:hypothetical protein